MLLFLSGTTTQNYGPGPAVIDVIPIYETLTESGKIYNSHTIYNKHIPYYSGVSADVPPTIASVDEL